MSTLRVTYRKSAIGYAWDQKATVAALGLRKLNHTVEHEPTPSIVGMVHKVRHLVAVNGEPADSPAGVALLRDLVTGSEDAA
jgi:large subunit ribosomal protein L30